MKVFNTNRNLDEMLKSGEVSVDDLEFITQMQDPVEVKLRLLPEDYIFTKLVYDRLYRPTPEGQAEGDLKDDEDFFDDDDEIYDMNTYEDYLSMTIAEYVSTHAEDMRHLLKGDFELF